MARMTEQQILMIHKMRQQNYGYAAIANKLGIAVNTVKTFCRRNGLTGYRGGNEMETVENPTISETSAQVEQLSDPSAMSSTD